MTVALHTANGDGNVINQAKTFSMISEGMMKSASNMDATVVTERLFGSNDGTPGHVPESVNKFFAIRYFEFQFLPCAQSSAIQFVYPEQGGAGMI
jgi:tRNA-binding EMAP/Myf-like protein